MTFSSPASQLVSMPWRLDQDKRTVLLGFDDGTVRSLCRCKDGWKLLSAFKPHKVIIHMSDLYKHTADTPSSQHTFNQDNSTCSKLVSAFIRLE